MLRLELSSTPECGTIVRALLMGLAGALAWDGDLVDDLKTAATEACNNVVLHAYEGGAGKLVVRLDTDGEWIELVVCDEGEGFRGIASGEDRLHVGLPVINSLAERAEFLSPSDGGTEVHMFFRCTPGRGDQGRERDSQAGFGPDQSTVSRMLGTWTADSIPTLIGEQALLDGDVIGVVAPATLLGPALGRLVRALAAHAHFRLDRFSELRVLADTLGAHARAASGDQRIGFALSAGERRLELSADPFLRGSGTVFTGEGGAHPASPLGELADELRLEQGQRGEIVRLVISDPR